MATLNEAKQCCDVPVRCTVPQRVMEQINCLERDLEEMRVLHRLLSAATKKEEEVLNRLPWHRLIYKNCER